METSGEDLTRKCTQAISSLLGYRECTLLGLRVKNDKGEKFRPQIPIYLPSHGSGEFPAVVSYLKNPLQNEKPGVQVEYTVALK